MVDRSGCVKWVLFNAAKERASIGLSSDIDDLSKIEGVKSKRQIPTAFRRLLRGGHVERVSNGIYTIAGYDAQINTIGGGEIRAKRKYNGKYKANTIRKARRCLRCGNKFMAVYNQKIVHNNIVIRGERCATFLCGKCKKNDPDSIEVHDG